MSDPLDLTRLLTGAAATVAKAFPEPLRIAIEVLDAGVGLAVALRDAGHNPVEKITAMRRATEDFTAARRRVHDEVDAIVDATLATPRTPTEPEGQSAAPADGAP